METQVKHVIWVPTFVMQHHIRIVQPSETVVIYTKTAIVPVVFVKTYGFMTVLIPLHIRLSVVLPKIKPLVGPMKELKMKFKL